MGALTNGLAGYRCAQGHQFNYHAQTGQIRP
jgi:hypothetical protein